MRSAARERAHDNVSENVSDVSDVSSPLADARTRKVAPARALAAALFHRAIAITCPRRSRRRRRTRCVKTRGGTKWDRARERRARRRRLMKRPVHVRTRRAFRRRSARRGAGRRASRPSVDGAARTQPPPETPLVASRVLHAARAGDAIGALAPWVFRAFAEDGARRARDEGHAARGGVASTTHSAPLGEAAAAETARREAPSRAVGRRSSRRSRSTRRRSNAGIPIPIALDRTSRDRTSRRSSFLSSGARARFVLADRSGAGPRAPRTEIRPATGSKPLPRASPPSRRNEPARPAPPRRGASPPPRARGDGPGV